MGRDVAAHRAHVGVEGAHRHHHVARQPELLRPLRGESPEGHVRGPGLGPESRLQRGQARVQPGEELAGRIPIEIRVPHRLVPGGATAALDPGQIVGPGQDGGNPVAVLEDGHRRPRDGGARGEDVEDLGPEPLRRVDAALEPGEVDATPGAREIVDPRRLRDRGVVLPEDEHRVGIFRKRRGERERDALAVGEDGRGPGGVDGDPAHLGGHVASGRGQCLFERGLHALEVVERMLAEAVGDGIAIESLRPARIGGDGDAGDGAAGGIGDHRPHGVGAEVDADDVGSTCHEDLPRQRGAAACGSDPHPRRAAVM